MVDFHRGIGSALSEESELHRRHAKDGLMVLYVSLGRVAARCSGRPREQWLAQQAVARL